MDPEIHDIRFVEDNWENPTLGAWGLGWEVWLNGMEVTQFTYFQQVGGLECKAGHRRDHLRSRSVWPCTSRASTASTTWSGLTAPGQDHLRRRVPPERSGAIHLQLRTRRRGFLFHCFEQYEKEAQNLLALENRCRCLPTSASSKPLLLQPAGCPQGHLGHRASALHPAHSHPDQGRGRAYYASREAWVSPCVSAQRTSKVKERTWHNKHFW